MSYGTGYGLVVSRTHLVDYVGSFDLQLASISGVRPQSKNVAYIRRRGPNDGVEGMGP